MLHLIAVLGCSTAAPSPPLDLRAALLPVCQNDGTISGAPRVELAVFEGPFPTLAVNLVVLEDRFVVDGEEVSLADLPDRLRDKAETAKELARRTGSPELAFNGDLILQLPATLPSHRIAAVLDLLSSTPFVNVQFVGRAAAPVSRPPVSYADPAFAARLAEAHSSSPEVKQLRIAEVREGVIESCPPLAPAMKRLAKSSVDDKCTAMIDLLQDTLAACPGAKAAQIVTLYQYPPFNDRYRPTALSKRLEPSGPVFATQAAETWQTVVPRLALAGPTIHWVSTGVEPSPSPQRSSDERFQPTRP